MKNVTYINAGAGSGKTFTLTRILADKLSDKETVLRPSQVILTTFTELAAAEFREKARQQILSKGCTDVAAQMDSAVIGTVHSVAFSFIKRFWYLLEYGADVQVISERDANFYMSQSLARIVADEENSAHLRNFRRFRDCFDIKDSYGHPDYLFWQEYLNSVVEKMEYYNVDDVNESIKKSLETVKKIYSGPNKLSDVFTELSNQVDEYRNYLLNKGNDKSLRQLAAIDAFLKSGGDVNGLEELEPLFNMCKDPVDKKSILDKCPSFSDFSKTLNSLLVSSAYLDVIKPFIESVFALAKAWRDDFVNYKQQNHIISYNDMERIFLRLLTEEGEVQDYVHSNFRLVMVDEFQDCNPIQLKIFNRLSELIAPADGHSYWVGDPKQAIYGFRGADTELVNSVSKEFRFYDDDKIHPEEGEHNLATGRLTKSWRSRKALVELVNSVFMEPFKKDGINELCIALAPQFKTDDLDIPAIQHWFCDENTSGYADAVAAKVKQLLASGELVHRDGRDEPAVPIAPRDVAILCRKNTKCSAIVKALRKYGIPVSEAEDAIMQHIEVQLVVNILQFFQEPGNKAVIANLMRLLWGKSTQEILSERLAYLNDPAYESDCWMLDSVEVKELLALKEDVKHLSIPEMLKAVIYRSNIPALVERWGDGHLRRQNLSTLQKLAEEYDQMCLQMGMGTSVSGFIYYLNSNEPDKVKDNRSNTVKVLTYHTSKGLEWPVVIMTDLDENPMDENNLVRKHFMTVREVVKEDVASPSPFERKYYLHLFPFVLSTYNSNPVKPLLDAIRETKQFGKLQARVVGEERRLLYVGMTRAKDCLCTLCNKDKLNWIKNAGVTPKGENLWGVGEFEAISIAAVDGAVASSATAEYCMAQKPTERTVFKAKYLSPSKIEAFDGYTSHKLWKRNNVGIDPAGWGKDYATVGSCIHDIFAVYRHGADDENRALACSVIDGYGLATELRSKVDAILQSATWLYEQLQANFPQQQGDSTYREYPFEMRMKSEQHLRGEMDLLWHYSDATGKHCVLVDYKTFPGVDVNEHTKKYYAQMSAYSEALRSVGNDVTHTLIYYPVMGSVMQLL